MLSKIPLLSLFLVLAVHGQTRPVGGKAIEEEEKMILLAVQNNMLDCGDEVVKLGSMNDLYNHFTHIENKSAVRAVESIDGVANTEDPNCETPKFNFGNAKITCLLSGVEGQMYAFTKNAESSKYIEQKYGLSNKQTSELLQYMEKANDAGYAKIPKNNKNKVIPKNDPYRGEDKT